MGNTFDDNGALQPLLLEEGRVFNVGSHGCAVYVCVEGACLAMMLAPAPRG